MCFSMESACSTGSLLWLWQSLHTGDSELLQRLESHLLLNNTITISRLNAPTIVKCQNNWSNLLVYRITDNYAPTKWLLLRHILYKISINRLVNTLTFLWGLVKVDLKDVRIPNSRKQTLEREKMLNILLYWIWKVVDHIHFSYPYVLVIHCLWTVITRTSLHNKKPLSNICIQLLKMKKNCLHTADYTVCYQSTFIRTPFYYRVTDYPFFLLF